jgi:uncharacterized protein YjiS (DUF1127 family)
MLTTIRSALRRAADHLQRRHASEVLHGASDHILRDIGVTRDELHRAVMCDRR